MAVSGLMAAACHRASEPHRLCQLEKLASEQGWKDDEEGCIYAVFPDLHAIGMWPFARDEFDVVLVDVTGELRPHYHERCDVMLIAHLYEAAKAEAYVAGMGWVVVSHRQPFVINREEVHGFRKIGEQGRFLLVNIESPGLEPDDTVYVDVSALKVAEPIGT